MARTPIPQQRTSPSRRSLGYLESRAPADAFGMPQARAMDAFGRAVSNAGNRIGGELDALGRVYAQTERQKRNFDDAQLAAEANVAWTRRSVDMANSQDPNSPDYADRYVEAFDETTGDFLSQMSPEGQKRYRVKFTEQKAGVTKTGMTQQIQGQSSGAMIGINEELGKFQSVVYNDPTKLAEARESIGEMLATAPIPVAEKAKIAAELTAKLEFAVAEGKMARGELTASSLGFNTGIDGYINSVMAQESGGNVTAKSKTSSATGLFQFTSGTWAELMRNHPELGLTADGRTDPAQQMRAMRQFTANNAAALRKAGHPVTPQNLYLAHHFGAGGAHQILSLNDAALITNVLSASEMAANPHLKGKTIGQVKAFAANVVNKGAQPNNQYTGLSFDTRLDLEARRQRQYEANLTAREQALEQQQTTTFNATALELELGNPEVTRSTVLKQYENNEITASQATQLVRALNRDNGVAVAAAQLAGPGTGPVDPTDSDFKKAANRAIEAQFGGKEGLSRVLQEAPVEAYQFAANMANAHGIIPGVVGEHLRSGIYNTDPDTVVAAARNYAGIRGQSAAASRAMDAALPEGARNRAETIASTWQYLGHDRAVQLVEQMNDPAFARTKREREQLADQAYKELTEDQAVPAMAQAIGLNGVDGWFSTASGMPRANTSLPSRLRLISRAAASRIASRRFSLNCSSAAISSPVCSPSTFGSGIRSLDFRNASQAAMTR